MKIQEGKIVELAYTLSVKDGEVVESSQEEEVGPLVYLQGNLEVPARLEEALAGSEVGRTLELTLEPEEAFGPYDIELLTTAPLDDLPAGDAPEVGDWIGVSVVMEDEDDGEAGEFEMEMRVAEVKSDAIVLDGNHPLAGKTIHYAVEVLDVREPTEADLEERHEHGPDCNHD